MIERTSGILHYNLVKALVETLPTIFAPSAGGKSIYADAAVKRLLKSNPRWGAKDRRFLAKSIYEVVRWWRKLWFISGKETSLEYPHLWSLAGVYLLTEGYRLPQWKEFADVAETPWKQRLQECQSIRCLRESIPDWLDETGEAELGNAWEAELAGMNREAAVIIRVNTLKTKLPLLQEMLRRETVETIEVAGYPDALRLDVRRNIFQSECFQSGLFEVQDCSSQQVAYFMDVKPGMRVIDACCGGGGKALHLASLMCNKGKIVALDLHEWKLKELRKRAARAGADIIETRAIESDKVIKRLQGSADRLLLDVPCSGLGTLRRNPDIKWKLTPAALQRIRAEQLRILTEYSAMTKPGGKLVYSTCSILPSENEGVITEFLRGNSAFLKVAEQKISPSQSGFDGFYMAALERKGEY